MARKHVATPGWNSDVQKPCRGRDCRRCRDRTVRTGLSVGRCRVAASEAAGSRAADPGSTRARPDHQPGTLDEHPAVIDVDRTIPPRHAGDGDIRAKAERTLVSSRTSVTGRHGDTHHSDSHHDGPGDDPEPGGAGLGDAQYDTEP